MIFIEGASLDPQRHQQPSRMDTAYISPGSRQTAERKLGQERQYEVPETHARSSISSRGSY